MAWIERIPIVRLRLVPDDEPGKLAATTETSIPDDWTFQRRLLAYVRFNLAGPHGERLGPAPTSPAERNFERREEMQHLLQSVQFIELLGEGRVVREAFPALVAGCEGDVKRIFSFGLVRRTIEGVAKNLERLKKIDGADVEAFISSHISEEDRSSIVKNCCFTSLETVEAQPQSGPK